MVLKNQIWAVLATLCLTGAVAVDSFAEPLAAQPVSVNQFAASVRASAYMPKGTPRPVMASHALNWPTAEAQSARLSHGTLSRSFDPAKAQAPLEDIRHYGLGSLRLKLDVFAHMDDHGTIDPAYLEAIETLVNQADRDGVTVILTEDNSDPCSKLPDSCAPLLTAIWSQVSERFKAAPPELMFELLSYPREHLTAKKWNALQAELITTVRRTNPSRTLIVTPAEDAGQISPDSLNLPVDDRGLIVAMRFDDPDAREFEANAALLKIKAVRDAEAPQIADIETRVNALSQWARLNDRPLFLKEVGSQDPETVKYRTRWTANLIRLASQRGLGWALGDGGAVLKPETIQQARSQGANAQMNAGLPQDLSAN